LKQGDALSPLLFNFALEYAIRRVQANQVGLKLNDTHQLLVYADDINILGRSVHAIKKNTEALVVTSKEVGLEVNAKKTKYMVMSQDQNAGQNHNMKVDNKSFERVEQFQYLGTTLTNQNSIQEEIKSRLKSGNACYHLVQDLLSSSLLYKNTKIKIYRTIILLLFYMGVKLGLSH
jgi:sorting nexin-29